MKKITELGISPSPWHVNQGQSSDDMWCEVRGKEIGDIVCDCMIGLGYEQIKANARLIAAAPKLYEALRELILACNGVGYKDGGTAACYESEHKLYAVLDEAEVAINMASEDPVRL